ncbi:hypothetical protein ACHABQ_02870 [Nesterenkonia aurantiaca]|uniref:hypothetical protein n=1 Tax=Nesterenkonia aurantiaca TaxID=1436010 RepID=UPI003EE7C60E
MAAAPFTGNIRGFTNVRIEGAFLWIHPLRSSVSGSNVLPHKPIEVSPNSTGSFTVQLEEHHRYRLEVVFPDSDRSRMGLSIIGEFRMPVGGGTASQIIGPPAANGTVRVLNTAPGNTIFDQYVYDETTGDLYERTS